RSARMLRGAVRPEVALESGEPDLSTSAEGDSSQHDCQSAGECRCLDSVTRNPHRPEQPDLRGHVVADTSSQVLAVSKLQRGRLASAEDGETDVRTSRNIDEDSRA